MMCRVVPCSLLAGSLLLGGVLYAQTPSSSEKPAQAAVPTLRANSRIVVVDVVVTDSKLKPVRNLKVSDFTLLEKGQSQGITHFEEHSGMKAAAAAKLPPAPKLEAGTFTNYSPIPTDGALNVLLIDSLNTPLKDQEYLHQQMLKYLATPRPGVRMAIFGLGGRLHLLQGFTSDPDVLRAAVNGKKNGMQASPMMENAVRGDTQGADSAVDDLIERMMEDPRTRDAAQNLQQFQAENQTFQTMQKTQRTLDELNLLGHYLSALPGRKNLIWFSGSFPVNILPNGDLKSPFAVVASMEREFHETINLLSRAQVAVYPIDARGLMIEPMVDVSQSGKKYANPKTPGAYGKDQSAYLINTTDEHATMLDMARDTGGKAFINTNGLKEAIEQAVDAGSNYYTLTYSPTNKDWRGDYRKIEVKLAQQGLTLSYRRGYYADDPNAHETKARKEAAATAIAFDPLHAAMQWGGPNPTEILFEASILPATDTTETGLAKENQSAPKTAGPYRRYVVFFAADPHDITSVDTGNGMHHVDMRFLTFVYNSDGELTTSVGKRVSSDFTAEQYKGLFNGGVHFQQEISVPAKGEYVLRVGVEDVPTQHVGALEVGTGAVSKLKSIAAMQAQPAKH